MANERLIKRRIRSAKNIAQITKAMQMVAASKMRRAQVQAISGRPYAEKIAEMVQKFTRTIEEEKHPLLKRMGIGKRLIILISTNKGLCGGLNANLFRSLSGWYDRSDIENCLFVTLGKKGENFLVRSGRKLLADFSERLPFSDAIPALTTFITEGFLKNEFNQIDMTYNNFISALRQEPTKKQILPIVGSIRISGEKDTREESLDFLVEPSVDAILDMLLFHYLENQIRDAVLEAEASEHSARMIAMKNATDNARELIDILTLEYNKARQAKITFEIADMITARLAVE